MIRNVLLDLDDTILDFHQSERVALTQTLRHFGMEPTEHALSRYHLLNQSQWKRLERGEITRDEVKTQRFRLLFDELGADCSPQDATAYYEDGVRQCCFFIDGGKELLEALSADYRLYIVTNGTARVQEHRIRLGNIAAYIDDVFISQYIGFEKPQAEFFDYCFAHIPDFKREETVIIGDSLSSDMQGGKNAGIQTVWYNPQRSEDRAGVQPDHEVRTLEEIPSLLKTL